jgi:4-carboxymuconolactone decarboxylase
MSPTLEPDWIETMDTRLAAFMMLGTLSASEAVAQQPQPQSTVRSAPRLVPAETLQAGAPALGVYTDTVLGDLWQRSDLSPRDRSLATVAALVSGGNSEMLPSFLERSLDSGVKPSELNEVIAHLAFYMGWPNGVSAAAVAKDVFAARGIGSDQLSSGPIELTKEEEAARNQRMAYVQQQYGAASPALVEYTNEVLFGKVWRRPGLAPRDRSLVTISALIAGGKSGQLGGHLNRGLDNGLTKADASAIIAHLAFYTGWPNAVSAAAVAKTVFERRPG